MGDGIIPIGSDFVIFFRKARKKVDGVFQYINDATVTYTLVDSETASELSSGTMSYVAGSDGNYEATILKEVTEALQDGRVYYVYIDFNSSGADDTRRLRYMANYRGTE